MRATIGAAILAACLAPSSLLAQADYTFTVPVEVTNMDASVTTPMVGCRAVNAAGHRIRHGTTEIPVDGQGNYSGDVVVEATIDENGLPAQEAVQYTCYFYLGIGPAHYPAISSSTMHSSLPEEVQPKPGEPVTVLVTGSLP